MARSKSSSSGLRLAFYPEHILWERELWSRLRDHIKQWLFVVNKARAACRGPSLSLAFRSRPGSSLPTIILDCQTNVRQSTTSLYIPFAFVHKNHEPGSATDKFKFVENSEARWKAKLKVCLERIVKTQSPEQLVDCTAWNTMSLCLFIDRCNHCCSCFVQGIEYQLGIKRFMGICFPKIHRFIYIPESTHFFFQIFLSLNFISYKWHAKHFMSIKAK